MVDLAGTACTPLLAGDAVRITAFAWTTPDQQTADRKACLVLVGPNNAPVEIRRVTPRSVPIDPTYFPLPPRIEESFTVESARLSLLPLP